MNLPGSHWRSLGCSRNEPMISALKGRTLWLVWVYNPVRKKGRSPKQDSHWEGPCTVLEKLPDVVYWVQLLWRGRVVVLHRDRLAPYRLASATEHPEEGELPVSPPSP